MSLGRLPPLPPGRSAGHSARCTARRPGSRVLGPCGQPSSCSVGSAWLGPRSSCFPSGLHRAAHVPEAVDGSLAAGSQQEAVSAAELPVTSECLCGRPASAMVHLGKGEGHFAGFWQTLL